MPTIRPADRTDAAPLAQLAEKTFRDTFGAANTAEDMELHCLTSYSETIQADEIVAPNMSTWLAVDGDRLIGFTQLRWGATPPCVQAKSAGEIQRLYVAADWLGKGVAQELMQTCLDEMRRRGADAAWLGVWERNPRAIAFYRKFGFVEVGEHVFPLGRDLQRDMVMTRAVVG